MRCIARPLVLIVALVVLLPAAAAQADTYCVGQTGCDHDVADLQTALNDAKVAPGPDTVRLAGSATSSSGFSYNGTDPVRIEGTGNPRVVASGAGATTLKVIGVPGSTIVGLDVIVQPGAGTGIETNGTADGSTIESDHGAAQGQVGVRLDQGGQLTNSAVELPFTAPSGSAVVANGADTAVSDSRLEGPAGVSASASGASSTVRRVRMAFSGSVGVTVSGGANMILEDVLLDTRSGDGAAHTGASVDSSGADSSLAMNQVTIAGAAGPGSIGLHATASGGGRAGLTFHNGVIASYPIAIARGAAGAGSEADVATDYSDYTGSVQSSGGGALSETNHLTADPGFVGSGDFHLRSDSPLVDAGDPAPLDVDESHGDASGQPRVVDGGGDCVSRRDVGAFEFQPGERAPVAVASVATTQAVVGEALRFDASQSCDPDGDPLTYVWSFDEGSGGEGVTRDHGFSRAGLHFGAVTVTDSTGRSTTAVAAVRVTRPVLPAFAGVTIPKQTVRVSKSGVAAVKLRCPLGTVGSCSGNLTLSRAGDRRMGTAAVAIGRGAARRVIVKLTRRARSALGKARRLNVTVAVSAHDANGTGHDTRGTIKLVAPRS